MPGDGHHLFRSGLRSIDLHPAAHVEDLVHLPVVRPAGLPDEPEDGRRIEKRVLHDTHGSGQVLEAFGLSTSAVVYDSINILKMSIQYFFDDGRKCTCRAQHQFAGINGKTGYVNQISEPVFSDIDHIIVERRIIRLWIFIGINFIKKIMASTGKSIAAYTAVVFLFVSGLTGRR